MSDRILIPNRRRWPRRVLVTANVLVAVCVIGAASAYGYAQWRLGQIHKQKIDSLTAINGGKPFTILVVGSDSRAALNANDPANAQFGSAAQTPGQRSDTIILVRVAPATRQLELLSIPRDLWVNIPGHGMDRINSAFDSGPDLLVQTIQDDLGIPINHYAEINFDTFQAITDAVGGVSFYFPTPAKDAYSLLNVPRAGCVNLTGAQALAFVRSRHYEYYENGYWHFEAESDLARIQRQQAFIKKMVKKAESQFSDPIALNDVIAAVTKNLTVDSNFSNSDLLNLARDFRSVDAGSIPALTLPNTPFTTAGGAEVLNLQQPQASETIAAFNSFGAAPAGTGAPPSSTSTLPPASISVGVANGTGVSGQAGALASQLSAAGFQATTITGSPGYGHATTEILYRAGSDKAAARVLAAIPGGGTLIAAQSLPGTYQVEVVTGASLTAAASDTGSPAPASGSTASTAPATSTTVPGTNASTYVLPGTPPGTTPPPC